MMWFIEDGNKLGNEGCKQLTKGAWFHLKKISLGIYSTDNIESNNIR
jgi:hypothetical protein